MNVEILINFSAKIIINFKTRKIVVFQFFNVYLNIEIKSVSVVSKNISMKNILVKLVKVEIKILRFQTVPHKIECKYFSSIYNR